MLKSGPDGPFFYQVTTFYRKSTFKSESFGMVENIVQ